MSGRAQKLYSKYRTNSDTSDMTFPEDVVLRAVLIENSSDSAVSVELHSGLDESPVGAVITLVDIGAGDGTLSSLQASGVPVQLIGRGKLAFTIGADAKVSILASPIEVGS